MSQVKGSSPTKTLSHLPSPLSGAWLQALPLPGASPSLKSPHPTKDGDHNKHGRIWKKQPGERARNWTGPGGVTATLSSVESHWSAEVCGGVCLAELPRGRLRGATNPLHRRLPTPHSGAQAGAGRGFTAAPENAGPVCHVCNRSGTDGNTSAKGIVLLCREAPLYSTAQPTVQQPPLKTSLPAELVLGPTMPCHPAEIFTINLGIEQGAAGSEMALSSAEGLGHLVSTVQSLPGMQGGSNPAGAGQRCGGVERLQGAAAAVLGRGAGHRRGCLWARCGAAHAGRGSLLGMRWG